MEQWGIIEVLVHLLVIVMSITFHSGVTLDISRIFVQVHVLAGICETKCLHVIAGVIWTSQIAIHWLKLWLETVTIEVKAIGNSVMKTYCCVVMVYSVAGKGLVVSRVTHEAPWDGLRLSIPKVWFPARWHCGNPGRITLCYVCSYRSLVVSVPQS